MTNNLVVSKKLLTFAPAYDKKVGIGSLAQLVEHHTFNVRVMGSSPMRATEKRKTNESFSFFCFLFCSFHT